MMDLTLYIYTTYKFLCPPPPSSPVESARKCYFHSTVFFIEFFFFQEPTAIPSRKKRGGCARSWCVRRGSLLQDRLPVKFKDFFFKRASRREGEEPGILSSKLSPPPRFPLPNCISIDRCVALGFLLSLPPLYPKPKFSLTKMFSAKGNERRTPHPLCYEVLVT